MIASRLRSAARGEYMGVAFLIYIAIGAIVAVAFAGFGVTQVQDAPVTFGARLLFIPASAVLWPIVLWRWLRLRNAA